MASGSRSATAYGGGGGGQKHAEQLLLASLQLPDRLPCAVCKQLRQCKRCSNCNSVWYCGRDCQRVDWPSHKPSCHRLQEIKRWSAFIEHLGGQFTKSDDAAYAQAPRDLSSMPMLPHLVIGTLAMGPMSGRVFLNTYRYGKVLEESGEKIPVYIVTEDYKSVESDPMTILFSFQHYLGGRPLDVAVNSALPVAIKRSCLYDIGFKLPPVVHSRRSGSESCVFVPPG